MEKFIHNQFIGSLKYYSCTNVLRDSLFLNVPSFYLPGTYAFMCFNMIINSRLNNSSSELNTSRDMIIYHDLAVSAGIGDGFFIFAGINILYSINPFEMLW